MARTAAAASARSLSAMPMAPAHCPSTATSTGVCPSAVSNRSASALATTPLPVQHPAVAHDTLRPPARASTPWPGVAGKTRAGYGFRPRADASARMARASGCSLADSAAAASASTSSSVQPPAVRIRTTAGRPSVSVPVLSSTTVSMRLACSSDAALFTSTPSCAPRPMPTMSAAGVASPSAHGQAMTSTATALSRAIVRRALLGRQDEPGRKGSQGDEQHAPG